MRREGQHWWKILTSRLFDSSRMEFPCTERTRRKRQMRSCLDDEAKTHLISAHGAKNRSSWVNPGNWMHDPSAGPLDCPKEKARYPSTQSRECERTRGVLSPKFDKVNSSPSSWQVVLQQRSFDGQADALLSRVEFHATSIACTHAYPQTFLKRPVAHLQLLPHSEL